MKAAQFNEYGGTETITVSDIAMPEPTDRQLLIEVTTASLNPFDSKLRQGFMKDAIPLNLPVTLGVDFAGILQDNTTDGELESGDEVYGSANIAGGGSGAMAEYAAADNGRIARRPTNISATEAASLVLTGVSALQAVNDTLHLERDQKILILGGGGGIGSAAIQIAKHLGAHVAVTASGEGIPFAKQRGADEVYDYLQDHAEDRLKDYDAVFDTVGGEAGRAAYAVLRSGGMIVSMAASPDEALMEKYEVTATSLQADPNRETLDELRILIEDEIVTPYIHATYALDDAGKAFADFENKPSGLPGKFVIEVTTEGEV